MEFTTRFGLHFQTARLFEGSIVEPRGPAHVRGLTPALGGASIQEQLRTQPDRRGSSLPRTPQFPPPARATGDFGAEPLPASLAVTKGILVSFFSSAY